MLSKAQLVKVRNAIEKTYNGKCTVIEKQKIQNDDHSTAFKNIVICQNQPCRVSFESITSSNQTDSANAVSQTIKLFISPDLNIKPGSKISVEQDNLKSTYECTGIPAIYPTHQEIYLKGNKKFA